MKTQWEILLFFFAFNLAVFAVVKLNIAGTDFSTPLANTGDLDMTEFERQFNATDTAESWSQNIFSGIPVIGDIFAGFNFLWKNLGYLIDGVPQVLTWIGDSYIGDPNGPNTFDPVNSGGDAFSVIAWAIRGVQALLVTLFLVEFISGRVFTD